MIYLNRSRKLNWIVKDIHGNAIEAPKGIYVFEANNLFRRILYALGARKRWIRAI